MPGPYLFARSRARLFLTTALALAGCGGGSGTAQILFSPATLVASVYRDESASFSVDGSLSAALSGQLYVVIADAGGMLDPDFSVSVTGTQTFTAQLKTSRTLAAGSHKGSLEVHVCRDASCGSEVAAGSLPYDITVRGFDLTPLAPLPGVADWSTWRGNAAHTGYVPASFDATAIGRRWWMNPLTSTNPTYVSGVAVDSGRVFLSLSPSAFPTADLPRVRAIDEATGEALWTYTSTTDWPFLAPAAANGKVYAVRGTGFVVLDAATGALVAETPAPANTRLTGGATPSGGVVLVATYDSTTYSVPGVAVFDGASGALLWAAQTNTWPTPFVAAGLLLAGEYPNTIRALDPADGTTAWTYTPTTSLTFGAMGGYAISTPEGFICTDSGAVCFDATTRTTASFTLTAGAEIVAFAKGVVYAARGGNPPYTDPDVLEAYDFATGSLLWSWTSDPYTFDPAVVVTDDLLLVQEPYATVAVDLATHQTVWSEPIWGRSLAFSRTGVLYVVETSESHYGPRLVAFNLPAR